MFVAKNPSLICGIVLLLAGLWAYKKTRQADSLDLSKATCNMLEKMHKHNLSLKDKAVEQYYRLFRLEDFSALLEEFVSTIPEYKSILQNEKNQAGRKKLSKKKMKRRQQVDTLFDRIDSKAQKEWTLDDILSLGRLIDSLPAEHNKKYKGIARRKEKDRIWNRLLIRINNLKSHYASIFTDNTLASMLNDFTRRSECIASLLWLKDLFDKVPIDILPTRYISSDIHNQASNLEDQLSELSEKISNRIKELQYMAKETKGDGLK